MNENLNLVEILKYCPKGTKLYSPALGEVYFAAINYYDRTYPIIVKTEDETFCFTKQGKLYEIKQSECLLFPSKEQRDWSKFKVKKPKFDPKTLQPYMKVLVRDSYKSQWKCEFYSHERKNEKSTFKYVVTGSSIANVYCIPYNDDTKHLVGTAEQAPEYYRYWED